MIRLDNPGLLPSNLQGVSGDAGGKSGKSDGGLAKAAREFESLFVQMMLKNMRAASLSDGLLDNQGSELYLDMFDKEIAREMASTQSLGIATMLVQQLGGEIEQRSANPSAPYGRSVPFVAGRSSQPGFTGQHHLATADAVRERTTAASDEVPAQAAMDLSAPGGPLVTGFDSPDGFVAALWNAAQDPARALGVSPATLIAQSALETGWGKHIPKRADGTSGHNLFGIKAGANWTGDTITKTTLEYENGIAEPRREVFRAYGSFAESFTDYVRLVGRAPRYREAMEAGSDANAFFSELQRAGYATDPDYAKKAITLLQGQTMQAALQRLGAS